MSVEWFLTLRIAEKRKRQESNEQGFKYQTIHVDPLLSYHSADRDGLRALGKTVEKGGCLELLF